MEDNLKVSLVVMMWAMGMEVTEQIIEPGNIITAICINIDIPNC